MGGPVLGFTASCIDHVIKCSNHRTEDQEVFQLITEQMNGIVPLPKGQNTTKYLNTEGTM